MLLVKRPQKRARTVTRYYLWLDGRAWRLTHNLHTGIVSGEIRFPNFANTYQRLMRVSTSQIGQRRTVQVQASTYLFDKDGRLDLVDQANAAQDIAGVERQNNVMDVKRILAGRRWQLKHHWEPPNEAILQVEADILPEKRTGDFKAAPIWRLELP